MIQSVQKAETRTRRPVWDAGGVWVVFSMIINVREYIYIQRTADHTTSRKGTNNTESTARSEELEREKRVSGIYRRVERLERT